MKKTCKCGQAMNLQLRTVIYAGKFEIDNVPIFSCGDCQRSEVYPAVKEDLTSFIDQLSQEEEPVATYRFEEHNELAWLLHRALDQQHFTDPIRRIIDERINDLLDVMLLAKSLGDEAWLEETRDRLRQITGHYATVESFD